MKRLIAIGCAALAAATCAFGRDTAIYNGKLTSDLNANGNAVTSLKEPSADSDAATKKYVDAATAGAGKVQSVNGATGAVVLAASDVGVGLTNGVITIDGEEIAPLTAHQSLDAYAKTTDVNAADASLSDYTTGVSNKVEAAQSAADANATKIAALTSADITNVDPMGIGKTGKMSERFVLTNEAKNKAVTVNIDGFTVSTKQEDGSNKTTLFGFPDEGTDLDLNYFQIATTDDFATKRDRTDLAVYDADGKTTDTLAKKSEVPTVYDWAKAMTKPTYTASEVGTYTTDEIDSKISAATPSDYATVKSNASTALSTANANKTSINTINSAGYVTKTTADAAYYPKASGDAWSTYWDGDDVRVTVTNYDSVAHLPSLYLEQRTNDTASASSDTNAFRVVWRELAHWDAFLGSTWNWEDATWQGFDKWRASLSSQLDDKADRAWGFYDSHTGEYAPDGYTSISSSNVMICAGASYQKTATATCDVWVLTANEPYEPTGISTNGGFQIKDADGNVQFEIVKGDKKTVKAQANATSVENDTTLVVTYNIVADSAPTGEVCLDLKNAAWKSETDSDCLATVVWSGSSGAWVARITPKTSTDKCFFKATYQVGGDTYVNNRCAVGMSQLVLGGTTYNLGTATIDGHTVLTLTPAN